MQEHFVVVIIFLTLFSFVLSMFWTPLLTHFLYKYKCWKKTVRTVAVDGRDASVTASFEKQNVNTPRMGGLLVWVTTLFIALLFFGLSFVFPSLENFNFMSRSQTWIPLFTLFTASLLGFVDDIYTIREGSGGESKNKGGGIRFRHRIALVSLIGLIAGSWMYAKLGWNTLHIPLYGDLVIGILFIPLFVFVLDVFFAGSVVDGIDGLSGGILSIIFSSFTVLAFVRGQYELAVFCGVVFGALLTFLWFNIPPARFYLGETGIMGLTVTLAVVAFFLDVVILLPLFAFIIVLEVVTNIMQLVSKRLRHGKKIFLAAPIHHHFQALGWPSHKVTMRFWLISAVMAMAGFVIALIDIRIL